MAARCLHLQTSSLFLKAFHDPKSRRMVKREHRRKGKHHRRLSLAMDEILFACSQSPIFILQIDRCNGSEVVMEAAATGSGGRRQQQRHQAPVMMTSDERQHGCFFLARLLCDIFCREKDEESSHPLFAPPCRAPPSVFTGSDQERHLSAGRDDRTKTLFFLYL
ncbi:hypothetical protein IHE45_08G024500 [Dioscorea alata]|uniref:Uncharacterized protein n=1 Tax=Dioscorea alata TaxID=55571 RepID=A0ACB7VHQ1_DIOAL|nr:hypothetical protein IHE45_08G024500 [Dioscorea alata]